MKLPPLPKIGPAALPKLPSGPAKVELPDMPTVMPKGIVQPLDNPLDQLEPTGDIEVDAKTELIAAREALRAVDEQRNRRMDFITDSEYWFAVSFQTREQKEAFLQALNLYAHGDKYLDGYVVARKLGVTLPPVEFDPVLPKQDKKLSDLT